MTPGQLREAIIKATLPLLSQYQTLTMAGIADSAGISEAELGEIFDDQESVMQACVAALTEIVASVVDPAEEVLRIQAIHVDQPLATRLVEVIHIFDQYSRRAREGLTNLPYTETSAGGTVDETGNRTSAQHDEAGSFGSSVQFRQAVVTLLEPDKHTLRLPVPILADAFVGVVFSGIRSANAGDPALSAERVVDFFLHGALSSS